MAGKPVDSFQKQKEIFLNNMKAVDKNGKTKLILIIMSNTLDPDIGKGCRHDIRSISQMFKKMSRHMKFNHLELMIKDKAYSKENILDVIDSLTPGSDDIVIFYYSGHGFRFFKITEQRYPQVDLRSVPAINKIIEFQKNSHNLNELFEKIKSKGARFNLVIGDCCNNNIKIKRKFRAGVSTESIQRPMKINTDMCKMMFCNTAIDILVAAADKGQFAVSDDKKGSIFTHIFTNQLKRRLNSPKEESSELPWKKLLEETKEKTLNLSKTYTLETGKPGNQKAIFDIQQKANISY